jgi:hypothetical protein
MKQIEFNKVYFGLDDNGYVNLLFTDDKNKQRLYFDGINFYCKEEINFLEKLSLFNYNSNAVNLYVEKITQDFDMSFIQISNGDVFQIYSMFNDEKADQKLTIFDEATKKTSTPLGISTYEAAVKRANEADETEVIVER